MDKNQNQLNAEADVVKPTNTSIAAQILNNINKSENIETETEVASTPVKEEPVAHVPQEISQPKSEWIEEADKIKLSLIHLIIV